jgi:hypothetical protein
LSRNIALQLMFAESKHRKDRFFKGEQAFTMLKHRCAALFISLMLKHRCATLFIFHDVETPQCNTDHFSDTETPLYSTVHFSNAETPLKNTGDCFLDAETPLIGTFHFFLVTETSHSPSSFSLPKQLRPALVSLLPPPSAATPFAATFPVAETPATFHFPPVAETPIVSNFSSISPDAETPLFNIFHPLPIIFPTPHHRRNNSVQQLFRLFCF